MAFFGGSTGVIYRQFSVTIISAMMLSVVVALTLTPALCGALLSHTPPHKKGSSARLTASTANRTRLSEQGAARTAPLRRDDGHLRPALRRDGAGDAETAGQLPADGRPGEIMVQYTLPAGATACVPPR
jgi:multidrug efflux pump